MARVFVLSLPDILGSCLDFWQFLLVFSRLTHNPQRVLATVQQHACMLFEGFSDRSPRSQFRKIGGEFRTASLAYA